MKWFLIFKIFVLYFTLNLLITDADGAKILSIFAYPGPSQYIMASALLKHLAERGHEITFISTFPQKTPIKNFRDIFIEKNSLLYEPMTAAIGKEETKNFVEELLQFKDFATVMVSNVLENAEVQDIMKTEHFDLIIVETLLCDALYGLGQHFKAPLVGVSSFGTINFIDDLVSNISPMSYIPHMTSLYGNRMSLRERFINVVNNVLHDLVYNFILLPPQKELFKKYFSTSQLTFEEARKSFSLILLNQHFSLSFPRPYVTNMIEVGGFHINQKSDVLPVDLQQFLDNATEGAIYFSMGSNLKSKNIPAKTLNIIIETFTELKTKILWKFEANSLPNKPDNVLIRSWYPQPSVLAHPNVKLFISHGGLLSTTETIFHGKPILGIPVIADQPMNVQNAVRDGYALCLKLKEITKDSFKSAITELLTNDSYSKRVQQLSRRYRDQPQTPLETATYWIEYVLRHDGAEHMRNAGVHLNFWQQNNIDVFAVLIVLLLLITTISALMIKFMVTRLCRNNNKKKSNTKRKSKCN